MQTGCHIRVAGELGPFGGCSSHCCHLGSSLVGDCPLHPPLACACLHTRVHISLLLSQKVQTQSEVYCFYLVYFKYSFTLYYML